MVTIKFRKTSSNHNSVDLQLGSQFYVIFSSISSSDTRNPKWLRCVAAARWTDVWALIDRTWSN